MPSIFKEFGDSLLQSVASLAEATSTSVIDVISIPIATCLTIYFLVKGYLIAFGRIDSPLSDFILTSAKIVLVLYFGLNATNYVSLVIPLVRGFEEMLTGTISLMGTNVSLVNAWDAIDNLWFSLMKAYDTAQSMTANLSVVSDFGVFASLTVMALVLLLVSVLLTLSAVGTLALNELSLTIALAFGPFFLCTLLFPITRNWFDGWMRTIIGLVFTSILLCTVLLILSVIFAGNIQDMTTVLEAFSNNMDQSLSMLWIPFAKFAVIAMVAKQLLECTPSLASAITGGTNLAAFNIAGTVSNALMTSRLLSSSRFGRAVMMATAAGATGAATGGAGFAAAAIPAGVAGVIPASTAKHGAAWAAQKVMPFLSTVAVGSGDSLTKNFGFADSSDSTVRQNVQKAQRMAEQMPVPGTVGATGPATVPVATAFSSMVGGAVQTGSVQPATTPISQTITPIVPPVVASTVAHAEPQSTVSNETPQGVPTADAVAGSTVSQSERTIAQTTPITTIGSVFSSVDPTRQSTVEQPTQTSASTLTPTTSTVSGPATVEHTVAADPPTTVQTAPDLRTTSRESILNSAVATTETPEETIARLNEATVREILRRNS